MKLTDFFLDLLYPPRCAFCRRLLAGGHRGICPQCREKIAWVEPEWQCQSFKYIRSCVSPLYYDGAVRDSLHRYKFASITAYADVYSKFIAKCIDENQISCDIITWVPLSRKRLRKRGYDQAELLARLAAKELGLPCQKLLKKRKDNPPQSQTGGAEKRRINAAGVYSCIRPELVSAKRVLILDDIVTTGATLSECARVLRDAGAIRVDAATVARSMR